jgi:acyl dehydratase
MRYFEDIEVGSVHTFGSHEVTREEVIDFASKYDPQPFHLSDEAAAQTHFGRLSASGWHTCAMTMSMIVAEFAAEGHAGLGSPGIDELRFLKPVYPGDTLRCESEILEKTPSRSRPEMGSYRSRLKVFNQHDVQVLSFIAIDLIRLRSA